MLSLFSPVALAGGWSVAAGAFISCRSGARQLGGIRNQHFGEEICQVLLVLEDLEHFLLYLAAARLAAELPLQQFVNFVP